MSATPELRIYVGHLKYTTTSEGLQKHFAQFGEVAKAIIIHERFRGSLVSRGFGFVTFANKDGYDKALAAKDLALDGFTLRIAAAKPPRVRDTVFIGGIPKGTTVDDLKAALATFHPKEAKIVKEDAERRGFAFVQLESGDDAQAASRQREIDLKGGKSIVRIARNQFGVKGHRPGRRPRRAAGRRAPRKPAAESQ